MYLQKQVMTGWSFREPQNVLWRYFMHTTVLVLVRTTSYTVLLQSCPKLPECTVLTVARADAGSGVTSTYHGMHYYSYLQTDVPSQCSLMWTGTLGRTISQITPSQISNQSVRAERLKTQKAQNIAFPPRASIKIIFIDTQMMNNFSSNVQPVTEHLMNSQQHAKASSSDEILDLLPPDFLPGKCDVICQRGKECFDHGKTLTWLLSFVLKLIENWKR